MFPHLTIVWHVFNMLHNIEKQRYTLYTIKYIKKFNLIELDHLIFAKSLVHKDISLEIITNYNKILNGFNSFAKNFTRELDFNKAKQKKTFNKVTTYFYKKIENARTKEKLLEELNKFVAVFCEGDSKLTDEIFNEIDNDQAKT